MDGSDNRAGPLQNLISHADVEETSPQDRDGDSGTLADQRRKLLLDEICVVLLSADLEVTPANLAAAHAIASGSNPSLAQQFRRKLTDGTPVTQQWLDSVLPAGSDSENARDKVDKLINKLESTMTGFTATTETARRRTEHNRKRVEQQTKETTNQLGETAMFELSRAMLDTLQDIQSSIEESQSDTAELRENLEQARKEADTDPLTELPNRRAFERAFKKMQAEAQSAESELYVAMCDVDHFKRVNDDFGHQTGDNLLRAISATLREHIAPVGFVARYGGEEFVLLISEVCRETALQHINAGRSALAARKFIARRRGKSIGQISFSAGVADAMEADDRPSALARADAALYRAKSEGRNRVIAAWETN